MLYILMYKNSGALHHILRGFSNQGNFIVPASAFAQHNALESKSHVAQLIERAGDCDAITLIHPDACLHGEHHHEIVTELFEISASKRDVLCVTHSADILAAISRTIVNDSSRELADDEVSLNSMVVIKVFSDDGNEYDAEFESDGTILDYFSGEANPHSPDDLRSFTAEMP